MRGILLVRHGNTTYDKKVDALLNPPLNEEGVERIKQTAEFLRAYSFKRVISSPLQRALRAAEIIVDGRSRVTTNNACLPWNLGDLMGKPNTEAHPKILYLKGYPDIKAPHGESYRTFYSRWSNFFQTLMTYVESKADEAVLVVTHSRNIDALQELIDGVPVGQSQEITPEGSVTRLALTGSSTWTKDLIWNG